MRLLSGASDVEEVKAFAEWTLKLGDGELGGPNDGESTIELPNDIVIADATDLMRAIVECTYPNLNGNMMDGNYFKDRAILAPANEVVSKLNDFVLSTIDGDERVYLSSDSVCSSDGGQNNNNSFSVEFLNSIRCSGLPNHVIRLKIGCPVMLMRNIDQSTGLCNGTRLIVTHLGDHVLQATVITGDRTGDKVLIPRITLSPSDSSHLPVKLKRRHFPIMPCFAMTINKSQGQSLSHVGLFLPRPVFTHGQLYVAVSRVTKKNGLRIIVCDKDNCVQTTTENVVYKEVFHNLC